MKAKTGRSLNGRHQAAKRCVINRRCVVEAGRKFTLATDSKDPIRRGEAACFSIFARQKRMTGEKRDEVQIMSSNQRVTMHC